MVRILCLAAVICLFYGCICKNYIGSEVREAVTKASIHTASGDKEIYVGMTQEKVIELLVKYGHKGDDTWVYFAGNKTSDFYEVTFKNKVIVAIQYLSHKQEFQCHDIFYGT